MGLPPAPLFPCCSPALIVGLLWDCELSPVLYYRPFVCCGWLANVLRSPSPPQLQGARAALDPALWLARASRLPLVGPEMAICGAPRASHFSLLGLLPGGCHGYPGRHVTMRSPWRPREEQAHGPYVDGAAFLRRDEFGPRTLSPLSGRWFAHLLLFPHPTEPSQVYAHGGVGG